MTDTREMKLGGRTFAVPALPLKVTMKVYPLCRKLTLAGLVTRSVAAGAFAVTDEQEMADVAEVAFLCCQAADWSLTRADFEALPIEPLELIDAFLIARYQTGGWLPPEANPQGDAGAGEQRGEASPPTSTSSESSPA